MNKPVLHVISLCAACGNLNAAQSVMPSANSVMDAALTIKRWRRQSDDEVQILQHTDEPPAWCFCGRGSDGQGRLDL